MRVTLRTRWDVPHLQSLALSPDGNRLASASSRSNEVSFWDASTGVQLDQWSDYPHPVFALAFSPDGRQLAYAGGGGTVVVRPIAMATEHVVIQDGVFLVTSLAFSPDSRLLAGSAVAEKMPQVSPVMLWDVKKGKRVARLDDHPRVAHCIAFSPDGKQLAVGAHGGFKLWTANQRGNWQAESFHASGQPGTFTTDRPAGLPPIDAVTGLAFSPDGNSLILLVRKSELFRWELDKRRTAGKSCQIAGKVMNSVGFLPQNGHAVTCGFQLVKGRIRGEVCIWDIKRHKLVYEVAGAIGDQRTLFKVCVSADGKTVAAMENTRIWVWDVSD